MKIWQKWNFGELNSLIEDYTVWNDYLLCNLVVNNLQTKKENLENACTRELYATKEAYELVKSWMSFRDAYKIIWEKFL